MSLNKSIFVGGLAAVALAFGAGAALASPGEATGNVHVRSGPGLGYGIVDTLYAGEPVDIGRCTGGWCHVVHSGPDGWVSANYLSGAGYVEPPVYEEPAPIYEEPPQVFITPPFYDNHHHRIFHRTPPHLPPPGNGNPPPQHHHHNHDHQPPNFPMPGNGGNPGQVHIYQHHTPGLGNVPVPGNGGINGNTSGNPGQVPGQVHVYHRNPGNPGSTGTSGNSGKPAGAGNFCQINPAMCLPGGQHHRQH